MAKVGAPTKYTPELAATICERLIAGESLRAICRDKGMPPAGVVCAWLGRHKEFAEQYARARELQAERVFEEIFEISDDQEGDVYVDADGKEQTNHNVIARAKLRVDTRKWALARMAPKKYGDRIAQEHSGAVSLNVLTGVPAESQEGDDLV